LGNSITDGRGSGTNRNDRWPDNLARRLQADPRTSHVAVLNAGIGGNAVLTGGLGPTALARLERDVLAQPGARWVIVLEGVNDIGAAGDSGAAAAVARNLPVAYREIIDRAHARGMRVYGGTITPFGGSQYDGVEREAARQAVNRWIRTSGAFDAVIDFDAALRDAAHASRLAPSTDTGDHLHPNEEGYRTMADAIDLALFVP
jgi:lysophospholipase L1-like esterase